MKLTKDQQIIMLCDAARASSMDGHIVSEPPPSTMAERVMTWFGGRKNTPRKNSYLYLDSVDPYRHAYGPLELRSERPRPTGGRCRAHKDHAPEHESPGRKSGSAEE